MNLVIAGDYCPIYRVESVIKSKEYDVLFSEIKTLTDQSDYSIVNLECPSLLNDYSPIEKSGPNLKTSEQAVEALKYAGFDMVTLANNHILDYGKDGLIDTLNLCKEYSIDTVGANKNLVEASDIFFKKIGDEVLAIINCCEHEFSIATNNSAGTNPLNQIQQYYQIKKARQKADYVLLIVHGGHEHFQLPSPRMVETYRFFIDVGADVVVNHHQHCYSGYELYKNKPIFYGLGNFCFDSDRKEIDSWYEGFILSLNLSKSNIQFSLHPYIQCKEKVAISFLTNDDYFFSKIERLNSIIADPVNLEGIIKSYYQKQRKSYLTIFEPYMSKIFRKLFHLNLLPSFLSRKKKINALNFVECESHREKLIFALKNK
ncbi:CapA family protein [Bacteroides sp.]|uniref:CapA family protein n=1 Tax=Bacteroides sp. TaxID=29523 RepID=UPI00258781B0|nr:CapA family protein [Bacteroides sp.]